MNGQSERGFVPYIDMFNHSYDTQVKWVFSDQQKGFLVKAQQDISRGEEIFLSYGKKSDSHFLINYGFIPETRFNEVKITIPLDESDPSFNEKQTYFL